MNEGLGLPPQNNGNGLGVPPQAPLEPNPYRDGGLNANRQQDLAAEIARQRAAAAPEAAPKRSRGWFGLGGGRKEELDDGLSYQEARGQYRDAQRAERELDQRQHELQREIERRTERGGNASLLAKKERELKRLYKAEDSFAQNVRETRRIMNKTPRTSSSTDRPRRGLFGGLFG